MTAVNADSRDSRMESDDIRSIIARIEGIGLLVLDPADEALVERVARAIAKGKGYLAMHPSTQEHYRERARTVLAALAPNLPGCSE